MEIVLDSSVLVAAFRASEPHALEALSLLEAIERSALRGVVPVTVPIEVVAAIRRRTGSGYLARVVGDRLLALRSLTVVDLHGFRLLSLLDLARTSGLRGMDVVVVGLAAELRLPLMTFDVELAHRASRYVTVADIGTIIGQLS